MKRALAILSVILALTSLLVPSIAVGGRGFVEHPSPTYTRTAQGTYVGAPCLLKGGKANNCPRPDLGVLPTPSAPGAGHRTVEHPLFADAMPAAAIIEPTLRPPRNR